MGKGAAASYSIGSGLGPALHLPGIDVLEVGREGPWVAEGIHDRSGAVALDLVPHRTGSVMVASSGVGNWEVA